MTQQGSNSRWFLTLGTSLMAASLPLTCTNCAYANADRAALQLHNAAARDELRAARHERREMRMQARIENASPGRTILPTSTVNNIAPVRTHIERGNTAVLFPGQMSTFHTRRPHQASTYINDSGRTKELSRGLALDLSSTNANITVGAELLDGSTTIQVGDDSKTVKAGTKLTAAEYAALSQKLATGSQALVLSSKGAAEGGSLNLNLVSDDGSTIRASQLVVPQNVTVSGDFARTADGVRVTKDIVNYGSLLATSSDAGKNTALIGARDINNQQGASIASLASASNPQLNLSLRADRDLNNDGSITAAGSLELYAGNTINNHGSATATKGDITLSAASDVVLQVDGYNGTFSAANGAINIRESNYSGSADSSVYGGNYYSQDLNVNAGQGTANLRVNEVTGRVNSTGAAVHFSANTSDLVLGTQCLTGDPTYFNNGNIILGGDINVDEALAIIAGGDITTTKVDLTIRTRGASNVGHDINIIAGANITAGSGQTPGTLLTQSTGSISGNATTPVTVSGASATGGSVDLTGATTSLFIDASTFQTDGNGANVTIAAFAGSGGGSVLTNNGVNHQIFAEGNGIGNNGNVSLIGGAASGQAIRIGAIHAAGSSGTGAGTGDILIANAQPTTSDSNPITFGTNGSITSGNTIVASNTVGGGTVNAAVTPGANLDTRQNLTVISGSQTVVGNVNGQYTTIKVTSAGNLTVNSMFHNQGGQVELLSQGSITINDTIRADNGILIVAGGDLITGSGSGSPAIFTDKTGNTGNISVIAGASFTELVGGGVQINGASATGGSILFNVGQQIQNLRASSSGANGNGGDLNIIAYEGSSVGSGKIHLPTSFAFDVGTFANGNGTNGDLSIIAGSNALDAITMGGANARGGNTDGTGSIYISTSTPGLATLSTSTNFAGISSGDFRGGTIRPNAGIDIGRTLVSSDAQVVIESGAGGARFNDVSLFGDFQVNSLGNITVYGGTAVISGAGSNSNTLLWTALGDISFCTRINLHTTGGGTAYIGGGGGIALIAGGTVQTINSPIGGLQDASLETNSGYNGGNITVVAGASFTRVGNTVTINGSSGSNGSILFDGTAVNGFTGRPITHVDAHSQGGTDINYLKGGDITLISFNNLQVNPDNITDLFSAAGGGFFPPPTDGVNGNVTIVAPGNIILPKIDMTPNFGGSVTIRAANPGAPTGLDVTPMSFSSFGNVNSGTFLNGSLAPTTFNFSQIINNATPGSTSINVASQGNITITNNLDMRSNVAGVAGGSVFIQSGGNVSVANIDVSNIAASGAAGSITIMSNSATTLDIGGAGANKTGTLTANAAATGNGGEVHIINQGTGGVKITAVPSSTVTNGNGAVLELDAGSGNLDVGGIGININRSAVGANHNGGGISLTYGSLTAGAGNIVLTANGTGTGVGGDILVHTTSPGSNIVLGTAAGQFNPSTTGGGTMSFNAGGSLTLNNTVSLDSANTIDLRANGAVTLNRAINTQDIRISAIGGSLTVTAPITADPIYMVTTGDLNLNADQIADGGMIFIAGGNITTSTTLDINGFSSTGNGSNIVIAAGAAFTEDLINNTVKIDGASATGGNIDFTTGGGSLGSILSGSSVGNGGNSTLLAFDNGSGRGHVILSPGAVIDSSAVGATAGAITIIGSATTGSAISMGAVNTGFGPSSAGTGALSLLGATPNTVTAGVIQSDASYTGTFTGGALTAGSITAGALTTGFAPIRVQNLGSVTLTTISTSPFGGNATGGNVTLQNGGTGSMTFSSIAVNGSGSGDGGTVVVNADGTGGLTYGPINANSGAGGNGGSVSLSANLASALNLTQPITANGTGTNGSGGTVSVVNEGAGGIGIIAANVSATNNGGNGGTYIFDAASFAPTDGPITTGLAGLSLNASGGVGFNDGSITLVGSTISTSGPVSLVTNNAGNGSIFVTATGGNFTTNGNSIVISSSGDISINTPAGAISTSTAAPSSVTITAGGSINASLANIDTHATAGNNNGGNVVISAAGAAGLLLGNINAIGSGSGQGGNIILSTGNGGMNFGSLTTSANGLVDLTATDSFIFGANVTAPSTTTGGLSVNLAGGTPGDLTLNVNSNVGKLSGAGGGVITFNNGSNPLIIENIGAAQSLLISTTDAVSGITMGSGSLTTTGDLTLNTPRFTNNFSVSASSVTIQNLTGNLTINGTAGSISASVPSAGGPGFPSSPTAINFNSVAAGVITLNGTMNLSGDVTFNTNGGIIVSSDLSLYTGANNVVLNTETWTQTGSGNIIGNKLIILGNTILNTAADVDLSGSNTVFHGRDLAIIAFGNIILGNFSVDTSSTTGDAGDITMIAGFAFTPPFTPQGSSSLEYTLTGNGGTGNITQTGAGFIDARSNAGSGDGGNITVYARGNVTLGDLLTTSANSNAGKVYVVANGNIALSNIDTTGGLSNNSAVVVSAVPTPGGTVKVQQGVLTSGALNFGALSNGTIAVGEIDTGDNSVTVRTNGSSLTLNDIITAHSITLRSGNTITLPNGTGLGVVADAGGNGGLIDITANSITGTAPTFVATAQGTTGVGGQVHFFLQGNINVGATGDLQIFADGGTGGGTGTVSTTGNLTVNSGALNVGGTTGRGGSVNLNATGGVLTLNDTSFLSQISAITNGDGGSLDLRADSLNLTNNSLQNPLALTANGAGTGSGGAITVLLENDPNNFVIGTPTKAPKGGSDFFTVSAISGNTGGNGGFLNFKTGGNLVINTADLQAAPQLAGTGNGARYTLESTNLSGKAGAVIITGDLDADANGVGPTTGGRITIITRSKSDFVINGTKAPKNGIFGQMSASGGFGIIDITNLNGGVSVANDFATITDRVFLNAGGKGAISGSTIDAGVVLGLTSDTGAIGKKGLRVSAPLLQITTNSSANLSSVFAGTVSLGSPITVGKGLTVSATGDLHVDADITANTGDVNLSSQTNLVVANNTDIVAQDGSIGLFAEQNNLTLGTNTNVNATNGGIVLAAFNTTNGAISIGDNSNIQTGGKGDTVVFAIGQPPKKGTNPQTGTNQPGFTVTNTGKGQAFFGPGTDVVSTGNADVFATNKNVIFNNLSTTGNQIVIGDATFIEADPPSRVAPQINLMPMNSAITQTSALMPLTTNNGLNVSFDSTQVGARNANLIGTGMLPALNSTLTTATELDTVAEAPAASKTTSSSNDLTVTAVFHSEQDAGQAEFALEKISDVTMTEIVSASDSTKATVGAKRHALAKGTVVFAPQVDTTVETRHGTVSLKAGSIAVITQSNDALSVYDLHDSSKNAVVVKTGNKHVSLTPGRHITISGGTEKDYSSVNSIELVQHRALTHAKLDNGMKFYTSEFSIPSACYAVKPLNQLMKSKHPQADKLARRITKTAAVLMTLNPDNGDFVQYFKSAITAMK